MQSIFSTRTFWYNALSAASLILLLPELQTLLGEHTIKYVVLANAIVNIFLRFITKEPVQLVPEALKS